MTSVNRSPPPLSPKDKAYLLISPITYHQSFTVPATSTHEALKVSYAVVGRPLGEDAPTILFCAGMFGSRWMGVWLNHVAEKTGVRVLFIDRPGFGGSTSVPLSQRISVFLETIPLLLHHLQISHVNLVSHSSGTIFALNVLAHYPHLLSPTFPSISLLAPWVHQSHSSVSMLQAASYLPNPLLNHWDTLTSFIMNTAVPTFAASGGALSFITSLWGSKKNGEDQAKKVYEGYGLTLEEKEELNKLVFKYLFAENTKGGNEEARLCLKSVVGECDWDACDSYPSFVKNISETWKSRVEEGMPKLRLKVLFAEEDMMIGVKGRKYFQECFSQEKCGEGIEVSCTLTEGTDHESLVDCTTGFIEEAFRFSAEGSS
ncbi:Alpha/Beta hydrolase protein [Halenospora varia]|nr:Alpha/Beta hydrolase protein [Halenospora varia]